MREISATGASKRFADLLGAVDELPPDDRWAADLLELRQFAGEVSGRDPWTRLILHTGVFVAVERGRSISADVMPDDADTAMAASPRPSS